MNSFDKYLEQIYFAWVVLIVSFIVSRILRFVIGRFIRGAAKKLHVEPTRFNFFKNAVDFIILLIASIVIFQSNPAFHSLGTTLLTGAGVLAAIVGFASKSAFSNIISGSFVVIFKPFSPLWIDNKSTHVLTKGDHPVMVRVLFFGDFGILLRAYVWATSPNNGFDLKCDLNQSIKERFEKEGIEFGYPVRVLINK